MAALLGSSTPGLLNATNIEYIGTRNASGIVHLSDASCTHHVEVGAGHAAVVAAAQLQARAPQAPRAHGRADWHGGMQPLLTPLHARGVQDLMPGSDAVVLTTG